MGSAAALGASAHDSSYRRAHRLAGSAVGRARVAAALAVLRAVCVGEHLRGACRIAVLALCELRIHRCAGASAVRCAKRRGHARRVLRWRGGQRTRRWPRHGHARSAARNGRCARGESRTGVRCAAQRCRGRPRERHRYAGSGRRGRKSHLRAPGGYAAYHPKLVAACVYCGHHRTGDDDRHVCRLSVQSHHCRGLSHRGRAYRLHGDLLRTRKPPRARLPAVSAAPPIAQLRRGQRAPAHACGALHWDHSAAHYSRALGRSSPARHRSELRALGRQGRSRTAFSACSYGGEGAGQGLH